MAVAGSGTMIRVSYTFTGWNTVYDGSVITRTANSIYSMGAADETLYAMWTTNPTYTVIYNDNGSFSGSVPTDSVNYEEGQIVSIPGNTGNLVNGDYTFVGWKTQLDGNGTTNNQGQLFPIGTADIIAYLNPGSTYAGQLCNGLSSGDYNDWKDCTLI